MRCNSAQGKIQKLGEPSDLGADWTKITKIARSIYEYVSTIFVIFVQYAPEYDGSVGRTGLSS